MPSQNILFTCPVCKNGSVEQSDKNAVCSLCKTQYKFHKKNEAFSLKKLGDKKYKQTFKELLNRFQMEQYLKAHEWDNVAKGRLSDKEQKKYDEEQALIAEEQSEIQELEKILNGDLSSVTPIANPPVLMKKNETAFIVLRNINLYEERTKQQYVGGSRGVSFRVAKGVSFRVGGFKGQRIPVTEQKHIDTGDLVVTNKRVIFSGFNKNSSFPLTKLLNVEEYSDGISISREGKQKKEYYLGNIEIPILKHHSSWTFIRTVIEGLYSKLS
ncbi:MAG: hypothetical protein ACTSQN_17310 [Candidatus Heimdallarchaeota archaeon]